MKKSKLKVGDKVTYLPTNIVKCEPENGIVIDIPPKGAFITIAIGTNYKEVSVQHLNPGWDYKEPESNDTTAADDYLDYLSEQW